MGQLPSPASPAAWTNVESTIAPSTAALKNASRCSFGNARPRRANTRRRRKPSPQKTRNSGAPAIHGEPGKQRVDRRPVRRPAPPGPRSPAGGRSSSATRARSRRGAAAAPPGPGRRDSAGRPTARSWRRARRAPAGRRRRRRSRRSGGGWRRRCESRRRGVHRGTIARGPRRPQRRRARPASGAPAGPPTSGRAPRALGLRGAQGLCPVGAPGAPEHVGQELAPALHAETTVEVRHVLMDRRGADTESRRDLLLAVTLDQAGERLTEPAAERPGARLGRADQLSPDQRAELDVKELQQPHLAGREVPLPDLSMARDHTDGTTVRQPAHGRETVVDPAELPIVVEADGSVPLGVGDQLRPGSRRRPGQAPRGGPGRSGRPPGRSRACRPADAPGRARRIPCRMPRTGGRGEPGGPRFPRRRLRPRLPRAGRGPRGSASARAPAHRPGRGIPRSAGTRRGHPRHAAGPTCSLPDSSVQRNCPEPSKGRTWAQSMVHLTVGPPRGTPRSGEEGGPGSSSWRSTGNAPGAPERAWRTEHGVEEQR